MVLRHGAFCLHGTNLISWYIYFMTETFNITGVEVVPEGLIGNIYTYAPNQDKNTTQVKVVEVDKAKNTITLENIEAEEKGSAMSYSTFLALIKNGSLNELPPYIKMYEISGQSLISKHGFNRYQKDKKQDAYIKDLAVDRFAPLQEDIKSMSKNEVATLIKEGLSSHNNITFKLDAVSMIDFAPVEEVGSLVKMALADNNLEVKTIALNMLGVVPEGERSSIVFLGLDDLNIEIRKDSLGMIDLVPMEERFQLIQKGIADSNIEVKKLAGQVLKGLSALSENASRLQGIFFQDINTNVKVQKAYTSIIPASKSVMRLQDMFFQEIKQGLNHADVKIQKEYTGLIPYTRSEESVLLKQEVLDKVKNGFESTDVETRKACSEMIMYIPEENRLVFITKGLQSIDIEIQTICASLVYLLSSEEQISLNGLLTEKIEEGLKNVETQKVFAIARWISTDKLAVLIYNSLTSNNLEVRKLAIGMVTFLDADKASFLVEQGLNNEDIEVQKKAVEMIPRVAKVDKERLVQMVIDKNLGEELIKPPLYKGKSIDKNSFSRQPFQKTGSGLTLLHLKDQAVIRHIKASAFIPWQRLYEDHEFWQKNGFDYVPIEPILSYGVSNEGLVDVFSGVLDLNLKQWYERSNLFKDELDEAQLKIILLLDDLGINHGHADSENFCLRFFRINRNGRVYIDFTRPPRIYLIDFDRAVSVKK